MNNFYKSKTFLKKTNFFLEVENQALGPFYVRI